MKQLAKNARKSLQSRVAGNHQIVLARNSNSNRYEVWARKIAVRGNFYLIMGGSEDEARQAFRDKAIQFVTKQL